MSRRTRLVFYAGFAVVVVGAGVVAALVASGSVRGTGSYVLLAVGIAALILIVVWLVPSYQAQKWQGLDLEPKDRIELEDKARGTVVQLVSGLGLVATVAITLYQVNESRVASERTLRLTEEGQASGLFTTAVEQLGALNPGGRPLLEVRLGGISALGRFARRSEAERTLAGDILTAYIRTNAPLSPKWRSAKGTTRFNVSRCAPERRPREDINRAFAVLRTLFPAHSHRPAPAFDFNDTNLEAVNLSGTDLRFTMFNGSVLRNARFEEADLRDAKMGNVDARCASFIDANLHHATLVGLRGVRGDFRGAYFSEGDLSNVLILQSDFRGADFGKADLTKAGVGEADFRGADLDGVTFEKATFFEVRIDKEAPAGFGRD